MGRHSNGGNDRGVRVDIDKEIKTDIEYNVDFDYDSDVEIKKEIDVESSIKSVVKAEGNAATAEFVVEDTSDDLDGSVQVYATTDEYSSWATADGSATSTEYVVTDAGIAKIVDTHSNAYADAYAYGDDTFAEVQIIVDVFKTNQEQDGTIISGSAISGTA